MADATSEKIAAGLGKLALVVRQQAWAAGEEAGLTPTQSHVLTLLRLRGDNGLTVSALAAESSVSQPTVSDAISALTRKGLVAKARSDADARVIHVTLTEAGRQMAADVSARRDCLIDAVETLDPGEKASFVTILVKLISSLHDAGQIPLSRMCCSCEFFRPYAHEGELLPHHCELMKKPLGDADVRLDCPEHSAVAPADRPALFQLFVRGRAV